MSLTEFADLEPNEDVVPVVNLRRARLVGQAELGRPHRLADGDRRRLQAPRRGPSGGISGEGRCFIGHELQDVATKSYVTHALVEL